MPCHCARALHGPVLRTTLSPQVPGRQSCARLTTQGLGQCDFWGQKRFSTRITADCHCSFLFGDILWSKISKLLPANALARPLRSTRSNSLHWLKENGKAINLGLNHCSLLRRKWACLRQGACSGQSTTLSYTSTFGFRNQWFHLDLLACPSGHTVAARRSWLTLWCFASQELWNLDYL